MNGVRFVDRVQPRVKKISLKGMCFKCGNIKLFVPGHKVCADCHNPQKCHTCKTN